MSSVDTGSGGDGVTFECDPGYTLVGTATVTCAQTQWSGPAPTCRPMQCDAAASVANGVVAVASRDFGSTASATCNRDLCVILIILIIFQAFLRVTFMPIYMSLYTRRLMCST